MTTLTLPPPQVKATSRPQGRPLYKRAMHWIRRGHLYTGLFLFPWAILYGVTAILFNHPTLFPDQPTATFGAANLAATPLSQKRSQEEMATAVVAALNKTQKPTKPYTLAPGEIRWSSDFLFATNKIDGTTYQILYDHRANEGTIRKQPGKSAEPAPFSIGKTSGRSRGAGMMGMMNMGGGREALKVDGSIVELYRESLPAILKGAGIPVGEIQVTSAPELSFPLEADGKLWSASYAPHHGGVAGVPYEETTSISPRRFLLRLHIAHGYSGADTKWVWAIFVDATGIMMCFWGTSGLLMWLQLKATRTAGFICLVLGVATAGALGVAMYSVINV